GFSLSDAAYDVPGEGVRDDMLLLHSPAAEADAILALLGKFSALTHPCTARRVDGEPHVPYTTVTLTLPSEQEIPLEQSRARVKDTVAALGLEIKTHSF